MSVFRFFITALFFFLTLVLGTSIANAQITPVTNQTAVHAGLKIRNESNEKWRITEAEKIYLSACAAVQREFGVHHELRPEVTLVLGAEDNVLAFGHREIRLKRWNSYLFAQGVVTLAFEELLPKNEQLSVAKRAVTWADSTVDVKEETKP